MQFYDFGMSGEGGKMRGAHTVNNEDYNTPITCKIHRVGDITLPKLKTAAQKMGPREETFKKQCVYQIRVFKVGKFCFKTLFRLYF